MKSLLDRLADKVLVGDGCWEWQAALDRDGYGVLTSCSEATSTKAHRIVYELLVAPIPSGLVLDHLCANRACVRPDHLEPVTASLNVMRGERGKRTHCIRGHEFTPENTYYTGRGNQRSCRICRRDQMRQYRAGRNAA